jgi:hypothetical protein
VHAYYVVFFTNAKTPDDVIYKITKAVHDNKADMAAVFPALNRFHPEQMAKKYKVLQYHPGAIKYFTEKGMWPPKIGSGTGLPRRNGGGRSARRTGSRDRMDAWAS